MTRETPATGSAANTQTGPGLGQATREPNMRKVPLRGEKGAGMVALVDDEDYERVAKHRWRLHDGGTKNGRQLLYAKTTVSVDGRRRSLFMHKLITDWPRVDHENHNGLDNQRRNLRPATASQNSQNQRAQHGVTSDYKGVCWDPVNGKWRALIVRDGRSRSLGRFQ